VSWLGQIAKTDWHRPWPELKEFQRWKLPVGTVIVAENATVIYPNGAVEGWLSAQQRVGKKTAPEPSKPEPMAEEVAASPSPELVETLRRKEWIAASKDADPQAWRFETADTSV